MIFGLPIENLMLAVLMFVAFMFGILLRDWRYEKQLAISRQFRRHVQRSNIQLLKDNEELRREQHSLKQRLVYERRARRGKVQTG